MEKQEILRAIVEAIHSIEITSGQPPSNIGMESVPIHDLRNFDSVRGVEVTTEISIQLGISIDLKENLFVSRDGRRAIKMGEIVERVQSLIEEN